MQFEKDTILSFDKAFVESLWISTTVEQVQHFLKSFFDENNYYEFFPLHVVSKVRERKRLPKEQTKLI
jgi:hypothetical protein